MTKEERTETMQNMRKEMANMRKKYQIETCQDCVNLKTKREVYSLIYVLQIDADSKDYYYKIEVYNSYSIKDNLKSKAFRFDGYSKSWDKNYKNLSDIDIELPIFVSWDNVLQFG